ncbi:hypothetical protein DFR65_101801 [Oceanihabitans sediminis]|uniref:Uncharacterized protein n=1 Tax=Oceanihabitans sediminis TaxID=1812012 RepID=A0A368P6U5_9FLAO|nr:hypothetical protein [Oceanihabitans sediminis]RBP34901.1 hypothetical protein DFR65_101801 [Oceanihabitans sediminis]RCU58542.1 hypothetical protein DU428_03965 [Oceanihabitans sediminis]
MQNLFSISFSILILIQSINIGVEDISRINTLIEHAVYHQETYGDSFFEFLVEHYGDTDEAHDAKHEEHEDLPFKHHNKNCIHISTAFTFESIEYQFNHLPFIEIPFNFFYKEGISSFEKPSIFQPPRFA